MSGYQRFISYIYAYSLEGKGRNVGFAKVEVRGEQRWIGISLKGIYGIESMQVAVFWRNGSRVEILPLRTLSIYAGTAQAQYMLSNDLFREYGRGLEDAAGILIYPENEENRAYVTVWDEEEFSFTMMETVIQEDYIEEKLDSDSEQKKEMETVEQLSELEEESEKQTEEPNEAPVNQLNEEPENKVEQMEVEEKFQNKENLADSLAEDAESNIKQEIRQEAEQKQSELSLNAQYQLENENSEDQKKREDEQQLQAQILQALFKQLKGEDNQEKQKENRKETTFSAAQVSHQKEQEDVKNIDNTELWASLQKLYPQTKPFQAQGTVECLKIKPGSIGRLPRQNWILANNNFVLYGYMKYHYLILAKMEDSYLLGVPGKGDRGVQAVANQFGFEQFYPVEGKWGYWCVEILS